MKATSKINCLLCGWESGEVYTIAHEVDPAETIEGLLKRLRTAVSERVELRIVSPLPTPDEES